MPESNIDIIINTKRQGDAPQETKEQLEGMQKGLTDLEKATVGTRSTIGGLDQDINLFGTNIGSAADALAAFGVSIPVTPMQAFAQVTQMAVSYVQDSIGSYTQYIETVDRMASYTGMASDETSRLIQVADDLRIESSTLQQALKNMADNGITPSIHGIAQLSDQYLKIQDPLARAQFLTDAFGKAGVDMARIMDQGSTSILSAADAVDQYMVVTGKSREEAEKYISALDNWNDTLDAAKYQLASNLLPALTNVINGFLKGNQAVQEQDSWLLKLVPSLNGLVKVIQVAKKIIDEFTGAGQENSDAAQDVGNAWQGAAQQMQAAANSISKSRAQAMADIAAWNAANPTQRKTYNPNDYGGGRASGGNMDPGTVYKVGERETEFITVGQPSSISPAGKGVTVNLYFQSAISLANQAEAERIIIPYVKQALRYV